MEGERRAWLELPWRVCWVGRSVQSETSVSTEARVGLGAAGASWREEVGSEVGVLALSCRGLSLRAFDYLFFSPSPPRMACLQFTWRLRETTLTVSDFYCNTTQK